MKAPMIYIVIRRSEFCHEPVAWSFDKREAETEAERLPVSTGTYHNSVEECPPIGGEYVVAAHEACQWR